MSLKSSIKNNMPQFLKDAWRRSQAGFKKRLYEELKNFVDSNSDIQKHFMESEIMGHFATKVMRNNIFHPDLYCNQIRFFRLFEYFKSHYSDMFVPETKILDVGDSSGVLLKSLGKKGVSLDINAANVAQTTKKGMEAYEGSIYKLPFPDKSFDYAMSYQCLEHLEAPLWAIKELERVARKRVFISIPYVMTTKIYSKTFWDEIVRLPQEQGGWDVKKIDTNCDYHIFEFSSQDLISLLSYTNLVCEHNYPINYFEPLGESRQNKGSYFNFFDLKVKS